MQLAEGMQAMRFGGEHMTGCEADVSQVCIFVQMRSICATCACAGHHHCDAAGPVARKSDVKRLTDASDARSSCFTTMVPCTSAHMLCA